MLICRLKPRMEPMMKTAVLTLCLALTACVHTHVIQTAGIHDGVDVMYEYPKGQYTNLGTIDVNYYRPGFTQPSLTEAMPKVTAQARAMGGNAMIIRNHYPGEWNRSIIVTAEVLRVQQQ